MGEEQGQERQETDVWKRAVSDVGLVTDPSDKHRV